MADKSAISDRLIVQQKAMFRLAASKGFTQELIHIETGLPTTSLSDWATGKAKLSLVGLLALAEVPDFPLELLSLIMPDNIALVRVPVGVDYDDIAGWAETYTAKKLAAHRADSECQEQIGPSEKAELDSIVVQFPGAVAA